MDFIARAYELDPRVARRMLEKKLERLCFPSSWIGAEYESCRQADNYWMTLRQKLVLMGPKPCY